MKGNQRHNQRQPQSRKYFGSDNKPMVVKPAGEQPVAVPEVTGDVLKENVSPVAAAVNEAVHAEPAELKVELPQMELNKLTENPKATLAIFETALAGDNISEEDRVSIETFLPVIKRLVDLENQANVVQTKTESNLSEEKAMTTNTTAQNAAEVVNSAAPVQVPAAQTAGLVSAGNVSSAWMPSLLAAGAAAVTAGFDMVANDDLSKGRIIGTAAAAVVAVGVQQVIQRNWTDDQGTGVNCGIAAGVGLLSGGAARMAVSLYNDRFGDNTTEL